jgi:hypothetical protein
MGHTLCNDAVSTTVVIQHKMELYNDYIQGSENYFGGIIKDCPTICMEGLSKTT